MDTTRKLRRLLDAAAKEWCRLHPEEHAGLTLATSQNEFLYEAEDAYLRALPPAPPPRPRLPRVDRGAHVVYRAWGERGELFYVGVTSRFPERMRQHSTGRWWQFCAEVTIEGFETRERAVDVERSTIAYEDPLFNRVGIRR